MGRVGRAHGLGGEVAVVLSSNRVERLLPGAVLYADERRLVVRSSRPHAGRHLVEFEGVEDRDAAEALRGSPLTGDPLSDLPADEVWVHELVGVDVVDTSGTRLGRVTAVEANPAHDLLVLDDGALIPLVFVVRRGDRSIVVELPDGLLDLNRR